MSTLAGNRSLDPRSYDLTRLEDQRTFAGELLAADRRRQIGQRFKVCLLYTSDAADERSSVDLGGRRIIKNKRKKENKKKTNLTQPDKIRHI